jgi:hypothetical protein
MMVKCTWEVKAEILKTETLKSKIQNPASSGQQSDGLKRQRIAKHAGYLHRHGIACR